MSLEAVRLKTSKKIEAVSPHQVDAREEAAPSELKKMLFFCSGKQAHCLLELFKKKVVDAQGNVQWPFQDLALPTLTEDQKKVFCDFLFHERAYLLALQELCFPPKVGKKRKKQEAKIHELNLIGSTLPYLLFGPLSANEPAYMQRCLKLFEAEEFYYKEYKEQYTQKPSDIDLRATMHAPPRFGDLQRNTYYQKVRSKLHPKGSFKPPVNDGDNKFCVIPVKLKKSTQKIDFIVCFSSKRKCVFTLDALALKVVPAFNKRAVTMQLVSHIASPLQAILDHFLGFIRLAKVPECGVKGVEYIDKRWWFKSISEICKGKKSALKRQEKVLWEHTKKGYLNDPKLGMKGFAQALAHWLFTHHSNDHEAPFIFLLNALQFIHARLTKEQLRQLVEMCGSWKRFSKLTTDTENSFIADLAKLVFSQEVAISDVFSFLQVIAYLFDSKKCQEGNFIKTERHYHEFSTPIFHLCIGSYTLQLSYAPSEALAELLEVYLKKPKAFALLAERLLPHILHFFPLGTFWVIPKGTKKRIKGIVDFKKMGTLAEKYMQSTSPLLGYLGLLTLFANSTPALSNEKKSTILLQLAPTLFKLSSKVDELKGLLGVLGTILKTPHLFADAEVGNVALDDTGWMFYLIGIENSTIETSCVAVALWNQIKDQLESTKQEAVALKLIQVLAEKQAPLALQVFEKSKALFIKTAKQATIESLVALLPTLKNSHLRFVVLRFIIEKLLESNIDVLTQEAVKTLADALKKSSKINIEKALQLAKILDNSKKPAALLSSLWSTLLVAWSNKNNPLETYLLFITYLLPHKNAWNHDEVFQILAKCLLCKEIYRECIGYIHALTCKKPQHQEQQSQLLFTFAKKEVQQNKPLSHNLKQALGKKEASKLALLLIEKAFSQQDFAKGYELFFNLIPTLKTLKGKTKKFFQTLFAKSSVFSASELVRKATKYEPLTSFRAAWCLVELASKGINQQLVDASLLDALFNYLNLLTFKKQNKDYISLSQKIIGVLLSLFDFYPNIENSLLEKRKPFIEQLVPKVLLYEASEKDKAFLLYQCYLKGLKLEQSNELLQSQLDAIAFFIDEKSFAKAHQLINTLSALQKSKSDAVLKQYFDLKCQLLQAIAHLAEYDEIQVAFIYELIPFCENTLLKERILKALEQALCSLTTRKKHLDVIRCINLFYATTNSCPALFLEPLVQSIGELSDETKIELLIDSKILKNTAFVGSKEVYNVLVSAITAARALTNRAALLPNLVIGYLPHFLILYNCVEGLTVKDLAQTLAFFKGTHHKNWLSLIDYPSIFSDIIAQEKRLSVFLAFVAEVLPVIFHKKMPFEFCTKIGALIDFEMSLVRVNEQALAFVQGKNLNSTSRPLPFLERATPLRLLEMQFIVSLLTGRNKQYVNEGKRRLELWAKELIPYVIFQQMAPIINTIVSMPDADALQRELFCFLSRLSPGDIRGINFQEVFYFCLKQKDPIWANMAVVVIKNAIETKEFKVDKPFVSLLQRCVDKMIALDITPAIGAAYVLCDIVSKFVQDHQQELLSQFTDWMAIHQVRLWVKQIGLKNIKETEYILNCAHQAMQKMLNLRIIKEYIQEYIILLSTVLSQESPSSTVLDKHCSALWIFISALPKWNSAVSRRDVLRLKCLLVEKFLAHFNEKVEEWLYLFNIIWKQLKALNKEFSSKKKVFKKLWNQFSAKAEEINFFEQWIPLTFKTPPIVLSLKDVNCEPPFKIEKYTTPINAMMDFFCSKNKERFLQGVDVLAKHQYDFLCCSIHEFIDIYQFMLNQCILFNFKDREEIFLKINAQILSNIHFSKADPNSFFQALVAWCRLILFEKIFFSLEGKVKNINDFDACLLELGTIKNEVVSVFKTLISVFKDSLLSHQFIMYPLLNLWGMRFLIKWVSKISRQILLPSALNLDDLVVLFNKKFHEKGWANHRQGDYELKQFWPRRSAGFLNIEGILKGKDPSYETLCDLVRQQRIAFDEFVGTIAKTPAGIVYTSPYLLKKSSRG